MALKPRGRPKLKPYNFATEELMLKIKNGLIKDLKQEENLLKGRTDTIRLKLVRKAINIPHLILIYTQRPNTIKALSTDAEEVYRSCFHQFINICQVKGIFLDQNDDEVFKIFIMLKFPKSKVQPLLNDSDKILQAELKSYLRILSAKALFDLSNKVICLVLHALFKLELCFLKEDLHPKSTEILESLIKRLDFKLKAVFKGSRFKTTLPLTSNSAFSSVDSLDKD